MTNYTEPTATKPKPGLQQATATSGHSQIHSHVTMAMGSNLQPETRDRAQQPEVEGNTPRAEIRRRIAGSHGRNVGSHEREAGSREVERKQRPGCLKQ